MGLGVLDTKEELKDSAVDYDFCHRIEEEERKIERKFPVVLLNLR